MDCARKKELLAKAQETLTNLENLARKEQEALASTDFERMLSIDRQLELTVGEKERAIGAYQAHLSEHKC